jgi:hypothetical protein
MSDDDYILVIAMPASFAEDSDYLDVLVTNPRGQRVVHRVHKNETTSTTIAPNVNEMN